MNKNELKTSKLIGVNNTNTAIIILIMKYIMNWTSFWRSSVTKKKKELHMKRKFRED